MNLWRQVPSQKSLLVIDAYVSDARGGLRPFVVGVTMLPSLGPQDLGSSLHI